MWQKIVHCWEVQFITPGKERSGQARGETPRDRRDWVETLNCYGDRSGSWQLRFSWNCHGDRADLRVSQCGRKVEEKRKWVLSAYLGLSWSEGSNDLLFGQQFIIASYFPAEARYDLKIKQKVPCVVSGWRNVFSGWIIPIIRSSSKARPGCRAFRVIFLGWIFLSDQARAWEPPVANFK